MHSDTLRFSILALASLATAVISFHTATAQPAPGQRYSCSTLESVPTLRMQSIIASGDRDNLIPRFFGKSLVDLSNDDILSFANAMLDCKRANPRFQSEIESRWFLDQKTGPVVMLAKYLLEERDSAAKRRSIDTDVARYVQEIDALRTKFASSALGPSDVQDLKRIRETSQAESRKPGGTRLASVSERAGNLLGDHEAREQREKINRELAERNKNGPTAPKQSEGGKESLAQVIIYTVVDFCADQKAGFSRADADKFKSEVAKVLDAEKIPASDREKMWQAGQQALTGSGFRDLHKRHLDIECHDLRATMPQIFPPAASLEGGKKSPF